MFRITVLLSFVNTYSQFDDFGDFRDDVFTFPGASPSVQSKTTSIDSECGLQSLTIRWFPVQQEFRYVNSYSLQVLNNGSWRTLKTVNATGGSYNVTLTSFENGWNDSQANFNFRVRVNINLNAAGTYNYNQGSTLKVKDWCFGPLASVSLSSATMTSGSRTSNLLNGEKPTVYVSNVGARDTEYFTIDTRSVIGGTNVGWRSPTIRTYISDCPTLGSGCNGGDIATVEVNNVDLITIPFREPSGTSSFRRSRIRLRVSNGLLILRNNRTYYIHVRYSINGNTTRGFAWPFRVEFRNNTSGGGGGCIICPVPIEDDFRLTYDLNQTLEPYQIDIYNMSGSKVTSSTVTSKQQENELIADLPKAIYVIKSKNGTRKVY